MELKLGQKVAVGSRFVKTNIIPQDVEDMKWVVLNVEPQISRKHEVEGFEAVREGIVVGTRSIVELRKHYEDKRGNVQTKVFKRRKAYLVACDMRGTMLVPEESILPVHEEGDEYYEEFSDMCSLLNYEPKERFETDPETIPYLPEEDEAGIYYDQEEEII